MNCKKKYLQPKLRLELSQGCMLLSGSDSLPFDDSMNIGGDKADSFDAKTTKFNW